MNMRQRELFWNRITGYFRSGLRGRKVGVWDLSFKPEMDDIREAPYLYIIDKLVSSGAEVVIHDPVAMENAKKLFEDRVR